MKLVSSDIHTTGANIALTVSGDTMIAPGVQVTADPHVAVEVTASASLYNFGAIISTGNDAVFSSASSFQLFNYASGTIQGETGVVSQLGNTYVTNFGSIAATDDVAIKTLTSADILSIDNHGTIYGPDHAVEHHSNEFGASIFNGGLMESLGDAILI